MEMYLMKLICVTLILYTRHEVEASIAVKKFVQQRDISEHCRRRVVPSVFLGRQVADSSAHVMHFSRLDVPYSCSISVRTESGSNIILVVQLKSDKSIDNSCKKDQDQLLIYEIGETFGGYWGALSDNVLKEKHHNYSRYYTLKTTQHTPTPVKMTDFFNYTEEVTSLSSTQEQAESDSFVMMEVPLVNVSGNVALGKFDAARPNDRDELFDLIYDVTPRNGVLYETSMMPLIQFSILRQKGDKRHRLQDLAPRYQLDYRMQSFTPDYRLVFKTKNYRRPYYKGRKYYTTKRRDYRKRNKKLFAVADGNNNNTYLTIPAAVYMPRGILTTTAMAKFVHKTTTATDSTEINVSDTWQLIERYLKLLDHGDNTRKAVDEVPSPLLRKISDAQHNISIYLESNLSKYSHVPARKTEQNSLLTDPLNNIKFMTKSMSSDTISSKTVQKNELTVSDKPSSVLPTLTKKIQIISTANKAHVTKSNFGMSTGSSVTPLKEFVNRSQTSVTMNNTQLITGHQSNTELVTELIGKDSFPKNGTADINSSLWKPQAGSLVDHESWENVVQVAPVMAGLLNLTSPRGSYNTSYTTKNIQDFSAKRIKRKKRHIKSISVEDDRPRQLTTNRGTISIPERAHKRAELEDLAEVLELQDDEIQGRVAFHYWKSYVGSALFNICDYHEAKARHVYLFNSSRIIIALNNFTLDRMTIVVTETRVARRAGCPPAHLECQVSGVRVCVHHANACDGVPNCGSHDVYDEDRLLCGTNVSFHQTVCLAACAFLAMVLTLVYSVHYWLKRCVPKVSEAFFVYADKSENILYLDSVMRSPTDFDDDSRVVYNSSFFEDDILSMDSQDEGENKLLKTIKVCFRYLLCKMSTKEKISDEMVHEDFYSIYSSSRKKFSFAESELRKIAQSTAMDATVQTGDSLEMSHLNRMKDPRLFDYKYDPGKDLVSHRKTSVNELNTLRIARDMSASLQSTLRSESSKNIEENLDNLFPVRSNKEVELRSTIYDRTVTLPTSTETKTTKCEVHSEHLEKNKQVKKQLRFDEETTTISLVPESEEGDSKVNVRNTVALSGSRIGHMNLDTIEVEDEPASSSGRDFRRFWGSNKGKKPKKKTHASPSHDT